MHFSKAAEVFKGRTSVPTLWSNLLSSFRLLAKCESAYLGLEFLESKWLRKDELNGAYLQIAADLKKSLATLENFVPPSSSLSSSSSSTATTTTLSSSQSSLPSSAMSPSKHSSDLTTWKSELMFITELIRNVFSLVTLRQQMILIYRALATLRRSGTYEEILSELNAIVEKFFGYEARQFNHPHFNFIKLSLQAEIITLQKLIETQIKIASYNFKDSVLCLFQCKYEFEMWKQKFATLDQKSESQKLLKGGVYVYHWLSLFTATLLSKLTLYFANIFKKTELKIGGDFKNLINKLDIDYFSLIEAFIQRSQCYSVCLIYDTRGRRIDLEGYSLVVSRNSEVLKTEKKSSSNLTATTTSGSSPVRSSNLTLLQKHSLLTMSPTVLTSTASSNVTNATNSSNVTSGKFSLSESSVASTSTSSQSRTLNNVTVFSLSPTPSDNLGGGDSDNSDEQQPLTGLKSYPAIFCAPQEHPPLEHWPNLVSIIQDNEETLAKYNREPLFYSDAKLKVTYFVDNVEPQVSLVVIFVDKKVKKNEPVVIDFYNIMTTCLRNHKILERLVNKQTSK
jgi:hypothetical protein